MTLWDLLTPVTPHTPTQARVHVLLGNDLPKRRKRGDSKLTADQVRQIRKRLATGERASTIAPDFNVKKRAINKIRAGETWSEVI